MHSHTNQSNRKQSVPSTTGNFQHFQQGIVHYIVKLSTGCDIGTERIQKRKIPRPRMLTSELQETRTQLRL